MTEKKTEGSQPTKADENEHNLAVWSDTGLGSLFEEFFRPLDQFFKPYFKDANFPMPQFPNARQPILDIQDRGDHFSVTAELPGFTKDEVEVKVDPSGIE